MHEATGVHILTLGCARNEVDSEELAGRLAAGGFRLVDDPAEAETIVVNTCGFIEQAKKDSIDTILAAANLKDEGMVRSVVAVGCLAERYGNELAQALPEADGVLGFDAYPELSDRLRAILDGRPSESHVPRDRRRLLPITPVSRHSHAGDVVIPGHGSSPHLQVRRRLDQGPSAPLKIASGCDRRCAFCAIPTFRGSYLSRPAAEIVSEARWLAGQGVRELFLVSENTSSYGKDLGREHSLEALLADLSSIDGINWIRVSYLQPAEIRPSMIEAMVSTEKVVPYFDVSFQHASPTVLRRMRRFGDPDSFLALIERIRSLVPGAGIRSNVITGFPGETPADVDILAEFIEAARLDVLGVFGYSDEEGTEGARLDGHLEAEEIEERRCRLTDLATEISDQRAADRIGEPIEVLVETSEGVGRGAHQGPEVDGCTTLIGVPPPVGTIVQAVVAEAMGADLVAEAI